tara:strand:+ start:488 stop:682 length:195 start_codon:yes stop_codon:yes gene_type:complete
MNASIEGQNGSIEFHTFEHTARAQRDAMIAAQAPGDTSKITVQPTTVRAGGVTSKIWTVTIRWE